VQITGNEEVREKENIPPMKVNIKHTDISPFKRKKSDEHVTEWYDIYENNSNISSTSNPLFGRTMAAGYDRVNIMPGNSQIQTKYSHSDNGWSRRDDEHVRKNEGVRKFGSQIQVKDEYGPTQGSFLAVKQEKKTSEENTHTPPELYPNHELLPLVPLQLTRQETGDSINDNIQNKLVVSSKKGYDDDSEKKSRKNGHKKPIEQDSDTDSSSDHTSCISHRSSRGTIKSTPALHTLLLEMETAPEFTESLTNLKLLLKRSDLIEVKPPRYDSDLGRRRDVRYGDYFHDKFTGKAIKLKRYLQKLLQYSAQVANDELTRADIIADGPGLSDGC
jgi:hypothetical protein